MAEEEAARAFLELQVDGRVSGAAAVSWVAGHPRFAALSRPARAKAWSVGSIWVSKAAVLAQHEASLHGGAA